MSAKNGKEGYRSGSRLQSPNCKGAGNVNGWSGAGLGTGGTTMGRMQKCGGSSTERIIGVTGVTVGGGMVNDSASKRIAKQVKIAELEKKLFTSNFKHK